MSFHYLFPLSFIITLLFSAVFVRIFRSFLAFLGIQQLFLINYFAVVTHELLHYFIALLCFKWPKWEGVHVHSTHTGVVIKGGVAVKMYLYKDLLYNIFQGSFVVEMIHLAHQIIAGFVIGLAPVIIPYILLFFLFPLPQASFSLASFWNIFVLVSWQKVLFFLPVFFFGALIASPSWQDIKQTLPLFAILFFIPVPFSLIDFLIFVSVLMLYGIVLIGIVRFFITVVREIRGGS